MKQDLLEKIMNNTEELKELKSTLEQIKDNEIKVEKTFLTI